MIRYDGPHHPWVPPSTREQVKAFLRGLHHTVITVSMGDIVTGTGIPPHELFEVFAETGVETSNARDGHRIHRHSAYGKL